MIETIKIIEANSGCQVRRYRRDGTVRNRVARYWGIWVTRSASGAIIDVWSGPCTSSRAKVPESMRDGFAGYVTPEGVPVKLFR